MKKEWFSTNELAGIAGLPNTIQGINQKARREQWLSRRRSGIQGKAVEYHINSLPDSAKVVLEVRENSANYAVTRVDPLMIWMTVYNQLSASEREKISTLIIRKGVAGFMALLDLYQHDE